MTDDDRRRSDSAIPPNANWHSSHIDDFSAGDRRSRHRTFFDTWGHVVGQYSIPTTMDIRVLPGYAEARESRSVVVTQPAINPDTGYPVVFMRIPIVRNGEFIGCATANITFDVLTEFLAVHEGDAHTVTLPGGGSFPAEIKAADPRSGLAILAIKPAASPLQRTGNPPLAVPPPPQAPTPPASFPAVALGNADDLRKHAVELAALAPGGVLFCLSNGNLTINTQVRWFDDSRKAIESAAGRGPGRRACDRGRHPAKPIQECRGRAVLLRFYQCAEPVSGLGFLEFSG